LRYRQAPYLQIRIAHAGWRERITYYSADKVLGGFQLTGIKAYAFPICNAIVATIDEIISEIAIRLILYNNLQI